MHEILDNVSALALLPLAAPAALLLGAAVWYVGTHRKAKREGKLR